MASGRRVRRVCLLVVSVLSAACGAVLLGLSFLPYEALKSIVDAVSGGRAEFFDRAFLRRTVNVARLAGALLLCAVPLYILRRRASAFLRELAASLWRLTRDGWAALCDAGRTRDKAHMAAFVAIVLVAIALRLCFLFQPIRYDEAFTFQRFASRPLTTSLIDYSYINNHLFHTVQVHLVYTIFGNRPWVLRLPAFVAGVLIVPATYLAARALYSKHAGLLAAGLVASSSTLIEFSTQARGYSLICLLFLLLVALATLLKRTHEPGAWLLFVVLAALGFWTIPLMVYPFAIIVGWLLLSLVAGDTGVGRAQLLRRLLIAGLLSALLVGVLYAPAIHFSGLQALEGTPAATARSWSTLATELPSSFRAVWGEWNRDVPVVIRIVLVVGLAASFVLHGRVSRQRVPLVVAVVVVCAAGLALQRIVPRARYWVFLVPVYLGIVSAGLAGLLGLVEARLGRSTSLICSAVALVAALGLGAGVLVQRSVYYSDEGGAFREAEELALFFKEELRPADRVLAVGVPRPPLKYYFDLHGVPLDYLNAKVAPGERVFAVVGEPRNQTLATVLAHCGLGVADVSPPAVVRQCEASVVYGMTRLPN